MTIRLHRGDLPDLSRYTRRGRDRHRDHGARSDARPAVRGAAFARRRLGRCGADRGTRAADAPNLKRLSRRHAACSRFFISPASISACSYKTFGVMPEPVYCTKIASRLARTYTDKHGLKDLVREVLGHDLSKQQQSSDWGAAELTDAQVAYAASDVLYLHALKEQARRHAGARGPRRSWPRPASASCRTGCGSISPAWPTRTFSPIREPTPVSGPIWPPAKPCKACRLGRPCPGHIPGDYCAGQNR